MGILQQRFPLNPITDTYAAHYASRKQGGCTDRSAFILGRVICNKEKRRADRLENFLMKAASTPKHGHPLVEQ